MANIGASYRAAARWLEQLVQEGAITREANHFQGSPAVYAIKGK